MDKLRDLGPVDYEALIARALKGNSQLGVAGSFASARLSPPGELDKKQISSAQNDMLAVLMLVGEGIAFADPEAHNGVRGYEALAVAFQAAADFYRFFPQMHKPNGLEHWQTEAGVLPRHLAPVGSRDGTRAQRIAELAAPSATHLGQVLNLYHRLRKLEKKEGEQV